VPENVGYQMKTFGDPGEPQEVSRIDKIIIYCSEDNFSQILQSVNQTCIQNEEAFRGRLSPGGGTISPLEGVSIAKEPIAVNDQDKITGTQEIARKVDKKLLEITSMIAREELSKYSSVDEARQSVAGKLLWASFTGGRELMAHHMYIPDNPTTQQKNELARMYNEALYYSLVKHYVSDENLSLSATKKLFLQIVENRGIRLTKGQQDYLENSPMYMYGKQGNDNQVNEAIKRCGFSIALTTKINGGKLASSAIVDILS